MRGGAVMCVAVRLCAGQCGYVRGGAVMSGGVKIRAFNAIYNCLPISRRKNREG